MLCVWWDQKGVVCYELLKTGEVVNTDPYQQQIINLNHALGVKWPECSRRYGKVILLHDDAPSDTSKPVKDTLKGLAWEVLTHPLYSPDLAPSDYHLFRLMAHTLSKQHFKTYEEVKKIESLNGLPQNKKSSIGTVSTNYLKDGEMCS